jgi:hypothetical protein
MSKTNRLLTAFCAREPALWLTALLAAMLGAGCNGLGTLKAATTASTTESALSVAHDTTDSPELADVLTHLAAGPRDEGVEAWRCDPNPTVTTTVVCGQTFPSALHFAWTSCAGGPGPRAPADPMLGDGGLPPVPCLDGGGPGGAPGQGAPPPPGPGAGPGRGPQGGPGEGASSGTVDIAITVSTDASGSCSATPTFNFQESVTFSIDRSGPGGTVHDEGTTQSTSSRTLTATQFTKSVTLDVKHTEPGLDDGGTTELSGSLTVAFDASATPPPRTINGSLQIALPDGSTDSATLVDVVRDPPRTCRTPVSGALNYTAGATGTAHALVFGPSCGAATLDGVAVSLDDSPPGGGPDAPCGPDGGMPPGSGPRP